MSCLLGFRPGLRLNYQQWTFLPNGMLNCDYSSLEHIWMRYCEVLDLNRGNPFTTGFYDVLQSIGKLYIAIGVDGSDIASTKPSILIRNFSTFSLEIPRHNPISAHH